MASSGPRSATAGQRRVLAAGALALAAASAVAAVIVAVSQFPRGLVVAGCVLLGMAAAWHGVLRRGAARVICLLGAAVLVVIALALLLARDPLATILVLLLGAGSVACARAAATARVQLPRALAPSRPGLIFNPRSGGGKAIRFDLPGEARRRGIEPVEMVPGTDLADTVRTLLERGIDAIAVAGGDGTQAQVATVAAREGIPYACIPAGTPKPLRARPRRRPR